MERTDLMDTSIEMHKARLRLLREKGPQWRIDKTIELSEMSIEAFRKQTIRKLKVSENGD